MDANRDGRAASARILVIADWTVDPHAVAAACARRSAQHGASFVLVVPAWLHGLAWAGDPSASAPCARRQLETLTRLFLAEGLDVVDAGVGDPDPMSAIGDALEVVLATEVLLFARERRLATPHPLDLAHRAQRLTGLPVRRIPMPAAASGRGGHWRNARGGGHCEEDQQRAA
jgi:hypothetical protein